MTDQNNATLDLCTSSGGRAYIADYFATQLRRHDFAKYINSTLAADFACALAQHLSKLRAEGVQAGDERAKFETDYLERHGPLACFVLHDDGDYWDPKTRACWASWRSRAALASAPVAGEALQQLVEELSDLASDMAYEANQEMDQEKASRAALIERGERALRRFAGAAPQASEAVRDAALEDAAVIAENSYSDAHIRIRALKTQADKDGGDCAKGAGGVAMRDAAFEAVRMQLCKLPRYSFLSDGYGAVRRVEGKSGSWIGFDAAHALFDPVSVDAALPTPSVVKQSSTARQTGEKGESE